MKRMERATPLMKTTVKEEAMAVWIGSFCVVLSFGSGKRQFDLLQV